MCLIPFVVLELLFHVHHFINGNINQGYLVLLAVGPNDTEETATKLADKICNLRIFEDENGKMNRSLEQVGGSLGAIISCTPFLFYPTSVHIFPPATLNK